MRRRALLLLLVVLPACSKPQPPTLTPRSARVASISPSSVQIEVELSAHNPNGFPLVGRDVTASFELQDGTGLGTAVSRDSFSIPAEGDANVLTKLDVQWTSLAALAPYALGGKPVPYRLRGKARLGGEKLNVEVPFQLDGVLTAEQVVAVSLRGAANLLQNR
jgi:LEA14-like dessication related protein